MTVPDAELLRDTTAVVQLGWRETCTTAVIGEVAGAVAWLIGDPHPLAAA